MQVITYTIINFRKIAIIFFLKMARLVRLVHLPMTIKNKLRYIETRHIINDFCSISIFFRMKATKVYGAKWQKSFVLVYFYYKNPEWIMCFITLYIAWKLKNIQQDTYNMFSFTLYENSSYYYYHFHSFTCLLQEE